MTPYAQSIPTDRKVGTPEGCPEGKVPNEPKGCAGCGTIEKALMAPKPNAGHGYDGPVYCLSCNPRFFKAGVASLAGRPCRASPSSAQRRATAQSVEATAGGVTTPRRQTETLRKPLNCALATINSKRRVNALAKSRSVWRLQRGIWLAHWIGALKTLYRPPNCDEAALPGAAFRVRKRD